MNQIPICDTHAHYDDYAFDSDRDILLSEGLKEGGVEFAVNVGVSMKGERRGRVRRYGAEV